jgi:hypothetical protein
MPAMAVIVVRLFSCMRPTGFCMVRGTGRPVGDAITLWEAYARRRAGRLLALNLGSEGRVMGNTSRTCAAHIWQKAVA